MMIDRVKTAEPSRADAAHRSPHRSRPRRRRRRANQTVAILGLGYVGLPTAVGLHGAGHRVIGIDVDQGRLDAIERGRVDAAAVERVALSTAVASPRFTLTAALDAIGEADVVIICVPTPVDGDQRPDVRALAAACEAVVGRARRGQLIVLTSTTYVGCTEDLLVAPLRARGLDPGDDVHVAFCPERINPGVSDAAAVPRVVGGATAECAWRAVEVLTTIAPSTHVVSSPEAAELTKLVENTFRAVNVALANEFADAARALEVDIGEVIEAAASKPYGFMPFHPGPGVGGHCIPCDPHYLLWGVRGAGREVPLIAQAMAALAARPAQVADRVAESLAERGGSLPGARVVLVGLAYKPGVEDVRESPALAVAAELRRRGAVVRAHDPKVRVPVHDLDGAVIDNLAAPAPGSVDVIVVLIHQTGPPPAWLRDAPLVVDASYRLAAGASVVTP